MPSSNQRLLPRGMSFSTTAPYTFGKTSYLGKRYGDISNKATVGDVSKDLRQRILGSTANLGYSTNIGKDRFNVNTQITPFGSKKERFGPVNVGYQKNLGSLGQLNYTGAFDKNTNLKKFLSPENFNYKGNFGNERLRGDINITPKQSLTAGIQAGDNLAVRYNRGKDDQGRLTTVGGTFTPGGPFSFDYSQSFRPGQFMPSQQVRGNINTDGFTGSAYRNISQEEGKTYGGNFSKNLGEVTYGGSADFGPRGLKSLSGNLKGSDLFDLSYQRNRMDDDTFQNTIGANFQVDEPFSLNYSRTFSPGQTGVQTIGGTLNLPNTQASLSKTLGGEQSGKYTGSLTQKLGPVNLTASGSKMGKDMQDYNVGASVDLLKPNLKNRKRGTLNLSGTYGRSRGETGEWNKPEYNLGLKYNYAFKKGGKTSKAAKLSKLYKAFKLKK